MWHQNTFNNDDYQNVSIKAIISSILFLIYVSMNLNGGNAVKKALKKKLKIIEWVTDWTCCFDTDLPTFCGWSCQSIFTIFFLCLFIIIPKALKIHVEIVWRSFYKYVCLYVSVLNYRPLGTRDLYISF